MQTYLIDGNNLIWKIPELAKLQNNETTRIQVRDKLVFRLERFFANKKINVCLFFDGAPNERIGGKIKIKYSYERKADDLIRNAIGKLKNKRTSIVVSSDREIYDFAKINGCKVLKSEEFLKMIENNETDNDEEEIPEVLINEDWEKLFGEIGEKE